MYHRKSFSEVGCRRESDMSIKSESKAPQLTSPSSSGYSRRQWTIFCIMAFSNLFSSVKVSLQAPFYPEEAEKKGATASEYGLVFGVFELTTFIMSPIYGMLMGKVGPKLMFKIGVFLAGIASIIFGLLDRIENKDLFIWLSIATRILESLGATAANTSSFTIIGLEFPNSVATVFASLETFFGLGLILGPTVGGLLFEIGGFTLPFVVMGIFLLSCALLATFLLPKNSPYDNLDEIEDCAFEEVDGEGAKPQREGFRIFLLLKIPGVCLACLGTLCTSMSIGFISSILEPHIRPFNLSPFMTGAFFLIYGLVYAITAPLFGKLCDRIEDPKSVTICGAIFIITGFCFLGPLPFLPCEPSILTASIGLVFEGLGLGASIPSSFITGLHEARKNGFPDSITTYGLISGLWVSMFSLGAFIGPTAGGILFDHVGFRLGSLLVIFSQLFLAISLLIFMIVQRRSRSDDEDMRILLEKMALRIERSESSNSKYGSTPRPSLY